MREATKQMRNGYEAEIRVKLDSAAACLLLLHALVLSVLASTCFTIKECSIFWNNLFADVLFAVFAIA